jgi:hypothetical protein
MNFTVYYYQAQSILLRQSHAVTVKLSEFHYLERPALVAGLHIFIVVHISRSERFDT